MIDMRVDFRQASLMCALVKKIIAVLLIVWLPVFTGNAQAVSLDMQLSECQMMQKMTHEHGQQMHDSQADFPETDCNDCGFCHLAYSAYLSMPKLSAPNLSKYAVLLTPYLCSFRSITSTPLLPPPLSLV